MPLLATLYIKIMPNEASPFYNKIKIKEKKHIIYTPILIVPLEASSFYYKMKINKKNNKFLSNKDSTSSK